MWQTLKPFRTLIVCGVFAGLGLGFVISALASYRSAAGLSGTATAQVLDRGTGNQGSDTPVLSYTINGVDYESEVSADFYAAHPPGTSLAVRIDPERQDRHELYPGQIGKTARQTGLFGVFLLALAALIYWRKARQSLHTQNHKWPDV